MNHKCYPGIGHDLLCYTVVCSVDVGYNVVNSIVEALNQCRYERAIKFVFVDI